MADLAFVLLFFGTLITASGAVHLAKAAVALMRAAEMNGSPRAVRLMRAFRAIDAAVMIVGALLVLAVGATAFFFAWPYLWPLLTENLWPLFTEGWAAVFRNLVDAYHADRIVKFIVWTAIAAVAAFASLAALALTLGALALSLGAILGTFQFVGDQVATGRQARNQASTPAGTEEYIADPRQYVATRKEARISRTSGLVAVSVGLACIVAGAALLLLR